MSISSASATSEMVENLSSRRSPRSTFSTQLFDMPSRSAKTWSVSFRRIRQYATRRPIGRSSTVTPWLVLRMVRLLWSVEGAAPVAVGEDSGAAPQFRPGPCR